MRKIAIIDDNIETRQRLTKRVLREIKKLNVDWDVKDFAPLLNKEDYPNWIVTNKVIVLIVDERLKDNKIGDVHVDYNGHDLVKVVRQVNKELPIYIVSAHVGDSALKKMKGEFDDVISRSEFSTRESLEPYIKRFVRATQTYLKNYESEYKRLAELSELIALNNGNGGDLSELRALQTKLQIPLSSFITNDRVDWISDLADKAGELEQLSEQIKKLINK